MIEKIKSVIKEKVEPALKSHGGGLELLDVSKDGLVRIKFTGACSSCPGNQQTISEFIKVALQESCPDVKDVITVNQVSDDLINQALKILRKDLNAKCQ